MIQSLLSIAILVFSSFATAEDMLCRDFAMRSDTSAPAANAPYSQSFMWKVSKGRTSSYVVGSFHSDTNSVLNQWEFLVVLMENMRSFVSETSFAQEDAFTYGRLTLSATPALPATLGPALFERSSAILQLYGLDDDRITHLKPWAAFLQMAQPLGKSQSLDAYLYAQARDAGLSLAPLQSPEEIAGSAERIAADDQLRIVRETVCNRPAILQQIANLQRLYVADDVPAFLTEADRLSSSDQGLGQRFFAALVSDRNQIFMPRLQPELDKGNSLIAVGASHLYGEGGFLTALAQQGYTLEPVDRAALSTALFAHANQSVAGQTSELLSWLRDQGLPVSADAAPQLVFVPTPELKKLACKGDCRVSFFRKDDKIYTSITLYHQLIHRAPGAMVDLLGHLIRDAQREQMRAQKDNSCIGWNAKNIQNLLLQGKYLASLGIYGGGKQAPPLPEDCN